MKKYYTYAHYKADTNELFYIGKGINSRYCKFKGRNDYWNRIVNKHGVKAVILSRFDTELEALEHEAFLIDTFRDLGFKLANFASGGVGQSGWSLSEHQINSIRERNRATKLMYRIIGTCLTTGKQIFMAGTEQVELAGFHYSHVIACCNGKAKTHKGFVFRKELL